MASILCYDVFMHDTNVYKKKLEEELKSLEKELQSVGRRNPENPADWQATPADLDVSPADESELSDAMEEFEENTAILKELEIRYNEVKEALERIKVGTYGTCEISSEPIEEERLMANPAARTCIKHKDEQI